MHNRPGLAVGKFQIRDGAMMAGGAFFDIAITGKGAHGARPEAGIDPVLVASHITTALQSIVARNARPVDTVVVSVTQIHGGDAYNVIPERAVLRGTVRCFSRDAMTMVEERMRRIAEGVAAGFGATASLDFRHLFPPLVNHADEARFIADCAADIVGEENVNRHGPVTMASEDFSYMLERVPGAYIQIGNGDGAGACEVHNPGYDFNDVALPLGASLFARLVERRLARLGRDEAGAGELGAARVRYLRLAAWAVFLLDLVVLLQLLYNLLILRDDPEAQAAVRGLLMPARADAGRDRRAADRQHMAAQPRRAVDRARASAPIPLFFAINTVIEGFWRGAPAAQ